MRAHTSFLLFLDIQEDSRFFLNLSSLLKDAFNCISTEMYSDIEPQHSCYKTWKSEYTYLKSSIHTYVRTGFINMYCTYIRTYIRSIKVTQSTVCSYEEQMMFKEPYLLTD